MTAEADPAVSCRTRSRVTVGHDALNFWERFAEQTEGSGQSPCFAVRGDRIDENETTKLDPEVLQYVNRLSDYLFVLARKLNFIDGVREKTWQKA